MSFYPVSSSSATPDAQDGAGGRGPVMVAVPVSALTCPVAEGSGGDGRSGLVVEGAPGITSGEPVA